MTTKRAKYLRANLAFNEQLLRLILDAEQSGLTKATIENGLDRAFEGPQALAEHVVLLADLLEGELDKLRTTPPKGTA